MKFKSQQNHIIDLLFPIALLFTFVISALVVILLATSSYQSTVENSSLNYTARTSLSYISEKIHQNDMEGKIYLGTYEDTDALILEQSVQDSVYRTYIYVYENELKELYVKDGAEIPAKNGDTILPVNSFSMTTVRDGIFCFSCIDVNGQEASTVVSVRSRSNQQDKGGHL